MLCLLCFIRLRYLRENKYSCKQNVIQIFSCYRIVIFHLLIRYISLPTQISVIKSSKYYYYW